MRAVPLCVFFALVIQEEGRHAVADNDFRPMPIPLNEWHHDRRAGRVGTLHEAVNTDSPPSVAAVPAHYWEDALRHSVYLTLVRDKIDQLIAKGTVISPDSKPDQYGSKEVDDHDLWDKIKNAPFDRIRDENYSSFGDVTIMAKGRLLEENDGFRFTEDEKSKEKCNDESCMKGVKAFWSVKRVRQRDEETSPGKYHYELTFSVMSQAPKKQRKPYENPIRTFTVRENPPDIVVGIPQQKHNSYEPIQPHTARPQRAIWFHRNIAPIQYSQGRRYHQSLDRIFLSLFSDDESPPPEPPRYRPNVYAPPLISQHAKLGHIGAPSDQHQQKKLMPYPYKPPSYKYVRPPLPAPPLPHIQHHYVDIDSVVGNTFSSQPMDHRYIAPSNVIKTTRPAVLPTPPEPSLISTTKNSSQDLNSTFNIIDDISTKEPEVATAYKMYSKPKPTTVKVSYFPDHLRPPVYNAPPGVFVTMDKKPFKPMPPLKIVHSTKPMKHKPIDFRPSPQLLDMQFSDPSDSVADSAFRPIILNTTHETANKTQASINNKKGDKHFRKSTTNNKKPPKKHENIKSHRVTTSVPDIITVQNDFDDNNTPEWANVVGAFTRTTPMEPQKEKSQNIVNEEIELTSTTTISSTTKKKRVTSTTTTTEASTTSTTSKPTRRTRPPPKFTKPEKIKKHKRITTTTMKTPVHKNEQKSSKEDLTPQASSAATRPNQSWEPKNKTMPTTTSTVTPVSVTTRPPTSTTQKATTTITTTRPSSTTTLETTLGTTQPKNKNRFRQSTLMQKGTSVNHDKWSVNMEKNKTILPASGKFPPRRKGSNFQAHIPSSTPKNIDIDHKGEDHTDTHNTKISSNNSGPQNIKDISNYTLSTQPTYEETADQYESNSELPSSESTSEDEEESEDSNEYTKNGGEDGHESESSDRKEFIFELTSTSPNERTNEITDSEEPLITEKTVTIPTHSIAKNKTKCKKKHQNLTITKESIKDSMKPTLESSTATTTTVKNIASTDSFDELFGGFTYDDTTEKAEISQTSSQSELHQEESENHEQYVQIDDDFEDFLDELEKEEHHTKHDQDVEHYEDDDNENESSSEEDFSPFDNESEDESPRQSDDDSYDEYHDRSLSFLELMAME